MFKDESARKLKAAAFAGVLIAGFFLLASVELVVAESRVPTPQNSLRGKPQVRRPRKGVNSATPKKPRVDYSRFSHVTHVTTQKLTCDSCHKFPTKNWKEVRAGDAAFPDVAEFPEHASCLDCHRQQFFARERPAPLICSNCHVAVRPRDTARLLFPSLGDVADPAGRRREIVSEFLVNFPHQTHMDVIGSNSYPHQERPVHFVLAGFQKEKPKEESDPKSCVMCHQTYASQGASADEYASKPPKGLGDAFWLKKGTFKTIPVSHAPCSSCHNTEAGIEPAPSKCDACHKLLAPTAAAADFDPKIAVTMAITDHAILARWRRRESSGTFPHEGGMHPTLSCTSCHNIPTMNTTEVATLKVSIKSCGGAEGCHITATADEGGALNFEIDQRKSKADFQCSKCHLVFGNQPLPANHAEAIPKPAAK